MSSALAKSNKDCVCAGRGGYGCHALTEVNPGCLDYDCPFFKTPETQAYDEMRCRRRLALLHPNIEYKSRKQVMEDIEVQQSNYDKAHKTKHTPVILAIKDGKVTEYKDIESASQGTGLHSEMIRVAIKSGEKVHGIKFKRK